MQRLLTLKSFPTTSVTLSYSRPSTEPALLILVHPSKFNQSLSSIPMMKHPFSIDSFGSLIKGGSLVTGPSVRAIANRAFSTVQSTANRWSLVPSNRSQTTKSASIPTDPDRLLRRRVMKTPSVPHSTSENGDP